MTAPPLPDLRSVVEAGLGVSWQVEHDVYGGGVDALAGLALRDNPRRAQLVVSRVLGKHLPVAPSLAREAAEALAAQVLSLVPGLADPLVLGCCETATALGGTVAEALPGALALATTRRPEPGLPVVAGFDEEHSHAVAHALQLRDPAPLCDPQRPVVLVDDELSTGTTALNTVAALHALAPRERWVVATLLDLRPAPEREVFAARAAALGVRVDVVALLSGALALPPDLADRAAALRARLEAVPVAPAPAGGGRVRAVPAGWPSAVPRDARTGADPAALAAPVAALADRLAPRLSGGPVLVLGTEELMWLPLRLAAALPGEVVYQSTTRSPVLAADLPGYAVRRAVRFPAPDEPGRASRLHGLPDAPYADVVVVVDTPAEAAGPLAEALRPWASEQVLVVSL